MTVMPSSCDVADKAVSTEDASSGMEVARLEAVLAALVETKVEAMKASSSLAAITRRAGTAPPSPRRPRLTSSSTLSSSQNHHQQQFYQCQHHHQQPQQQQQQQQQYHQHQKHRHHHHHRRQHYHEKKGRQGQKHRRHGSAPCGDSIHRTIAHHHKQAHGKGRQKSVDIPCDGQKHWRHSRNSHVLSPVIDPRFELLGIDAEHDHALMNFERTREALSDEYQKLHQSACYISHSTAHLKSHYDEDDYLTFNFADMPGDEETFNSPPAADSHVGNSRVNSHERFHRSRRKRKRPKLEKSLVDVEGLEVDDLPPRARWTIVATACLLLAMSLLLVGVTLRMAPIIDEMGDGRRASVCKRGSISRSRRPSSARRRDSIRPTRNVAESSNRFSATSLEGPKKEPREAELARRRHQRITTILLATFFFILAASVFAVVVTLTHSSFHRPPIGSKELAEHRANDGVIMQNESTFRKENEELLNSLNRDVATPENITTLSF